MKNPKKGEDKKWTAEWVAPMTKEKFVASGKVQYGTFIASIRKYIPAVCKDFGKYVGQKIAGKKMTLSGLLALTHRAGFKGAAGWLENPEQRKKFPHTTETYLKATGAF